MDHWFSNTMFALLIIFFTYFYTALQFDPNQVSSTLKQQGGFIPGVKPGKKTAEFIENILTRVTLPGACFLGFIALMPYFLQQFAGLDYAYASFFWWNEFAYRCWSWIRYIKPDRVSFIIKAL